MRTIHALTGAVLATISFVSVGVIAPAHAATNWETKVSFASAKGQFCRFKVVDGSVGLRFRLDNRAGRALSNSVTLNRPRNDEWLAAILKVRAGSVSKAKDVTGLELGTRIWAELHAHEAQGSGVVAEERFSVRDVGRC